MQGRRPCSTLLATNGRTSAPGQPLYDNQIRDTLLGNRFQRTQIEVRERAVKAALDHKPPANRQNQEYSHRNFQPSGIVCVESRLTPTCARLYPTPSTAPR